MTTPTINTPPPPDNVGGLTRERVLVLVLLVATALSLYLCYEMARPFLPAIAWSLALAIVAHPLHIWIHRRVTQPNLAAALTVTIVAVLLIGPTVLVARRVVQEAAMTWQDFNAAETQDRWQDMLKKTPWMARAYEWVTQEVDLHAQLENAYGWLTSQATGLVTGSLWAITELLIVLFVLFYVLRDWQIGLSTVRSLVPLSHAETDQVFLRVTDTVNATLYGTLVVAVVKGVLTGVAFWALGLPSPLLWGVVTGLVSVIPVFGSFITWVPAALYLLAIGSWIKALVLIVWCGLAVTLIDNWVYPLLVGKKLQLHTVLILFAMLGGLSVFGASGLVLGPVVLAVTEALIEIWRRRTADGAAADDGSATSGIIVP